MVKRQMGGRAGGRAPQLFRGPGPAGETREGGSPSLSLSRPRTVWQPLSKQEWSHSAEPHGARGGGWSWRGDDGGNSVQHPGAAPERKGDPSLGLVPRARQDDPLAPLA